MPADDYRRALDAALREYEQALASRAGLDQRIAQLQQTIGTLTRLCGYTPTVPFGLTDACRVTLRCAPGPMTAVEVRDRLQATGFDLGRYANPLAAIHTVLGRLAESGEAAISEADETTRTAYAFRERPPAGQPSRGPQARPSRPASRRRPAKGRRP